MGNKLADFYTYRRARDLLKHHERGIARHPEGMRQLRIKRYQKTIDELEAEYPDFRAAFDRLSKLA